jgi:phage terminase large subunit
MLERLREMPSRNPAKEFEAYQARPVGFIQERLGCTLTGPQKRVCEAVRDYTVTVVQSANAVGKTHAASGVALWFLRAFPQSKVIATAAPPLENLERLLWGEVEARLTHTDAFDDARVGYLNVELGAEWWMAGRAIPSSGTSAQREAKFSGLHAPHLLFIVDEGDAVPDEVYRGIEACMSGGHVRLLVLFNPRAAAGPVYRMIQSGQAHVVKLDAFSHPNVVTGRDIVPGAVTRETTALRISEWSRAQADGEKADPQDTEWFSVPDFLGGATATRKDGTEIPPLVGGQWRKITNPALAYMVLARFPGQAENQLISRAWVEAAQQRWLTWRMTHGERPPEGVRPLMGLDVAEFGVDRNVECRRYGGWVAPFIVWNGVDVLVTSDRAAEDAREIDALRALIDATGIGAGVVPGMSRWWASHPSAYQGVALPVHVGGAPTASTDEGVFGTLRDQLWWRCREWLRADPGAMLPPDEGLLEELCAPTYQVRDGKIRVTSKEDLRKLLLRSPDLADALCLTFTPDTLVGIRSL